MTYKCLYKFVKKITPHQDALTVLIYGHQEHSVRYSSTSLIIFYLFVYMSVSFLCLGSSHVVAILSICLNDWHSYRYSRNSMSVELKCAPEKDRMSSLQFPVEGRSLARARGQVLKGRRLGLWSSNQRDVAQAVSAELRFTGKV